MDFEKEYKSLVGRITKAHLYAQTDSTRAVLEDIYPSLSESEDERTRKGLIRLMTVAGEAYLVESTGIKKESYLAYLEKLKEQKPAEWSEEQEEPDKRLEEEIDRFFEEMPIQEHENIFEDTYQMIARHFYELGKNSK